MTCAQGLLRLLWGGPKLECYGNVGSDDYSDTNDNVENGFWHRVYLKIIKKSYLLFLQQEIREKLQSTLFFMNLQVLHGLLKHSVV